MIGATWEEAAQCRKTLTEERVGRVYFVFFPDSVAQQRLLHQHLIHLRVVLIWQKLQTGQRHRQILGPRIYGEAQPQTGVASIRLSAGQQSQALQRRIALRGKTQRLQPT